MPNKNKMFILLLGVCLCAAGLHIAVKFKHQIKNIALKTAAKVNHIMIRKLEPARYVAAAHAEPVIFYSDLTAGPNTGGQNNNGVFVTIWGNNFGTAQGSSYITVGGGKVNNYPTWSNTMVCFQLGPSAASGNIVLVTSDGNATGYHDHIYFSKEASSGGRTFDGGGCGCN